MLRTPQNRGNSNSGGSTISLGGKNVGDLLNTKGITWGWFQGGFTPSGTNKPSGVVCATSHNNIADSSSADYSPHHEPFQYYASTSNPDHVSPSSVNNVGVSDPANTPASQAVNHQYDLSWFNQTLANGNMPAVSYLKAPEYEDGHAGYSDPLDEQRFVVDEINQIEESQFWPSTAIIIAYDDSDGWYDHQMGPIIRQSQDASDTLNGAGHCGSTTTPPAQNDRCGVGPRQPLLVISPWAKQNNVDNTFTDQSSILQFIEDNWSTGRVGSGSADSAAGTLDSAFDFSQKHGQAPAIILNDTTGEIQKVISPNGTVTTAPAGQGGDAGWNGSTGSDDTSGSNGATGGSQGSQGSQGSSGNGGSSGDGGWSGSQGAGSKGSGKTSSTGSAKLPTFVCKPVSGKHAIVFSCTVKGGSKQATMVRARLLRGKSQIANVAQRVRNGRVSLKLSLGRKSRAGRYTIRLSIDVADRVGSLTTHVTVR